MEWHVPPLWWFQVVAIAVVTLITGLAWWRRRKLLARLRREWGQVRTASWLDMEAIAEFWQESLANDPPAGALDERTWEDLELDRVITELDRAECGLGRQQFYRRLHAGLSWHDAPMLKVLAERFGADPILRDQAGLILARGGRALGYGLWWITRPDAIRIRWWYAAFPLLALAQLSMLVTIFFWPTALFVAGLLVLVNVGMRTATAWQVPTLLAPMRQLSPLAKSADRLLSLLRDQDLDLSVVQRDVRVIRPIRWLAAWVSRDPVASGMLSMAITEYFNLLFLLDANALLFGSRWLRKHGPTLGRVGAWVGDVDLARAVASLRAEPRGWCIPGSDESGDAKGHDVWHPLVQDPVVNDVEFVHGRGMVITGANMSGKSTYLRTVGIATVLARVINTCPAASWNAPPLAVRSLIGRADDLEAGKSYYQVEADGVVELLEVATGALPTLFLLDELLRGTNTVERLAAGEAVLRALLGASDTNRPHAVIVATHDGELVGMLADCFVPWHFREQIGAGGLTFDYRRLEGPATTRTAIALLEASGAPAGVVERARARADELDGGRG